MSADDNNRTAVITLSSRRISRTPKSAINRYLRGVNTVRREDHEQSIADWPIVEEMRLMLARHITDGLYLDGQPALHHVLDYAVDGYIGCLVQSRKGRIQAWLHSAAVAWADLPMFYVHFDKTVWRPFCDSHLSDELARSTTLRLEIENGTPDLRRLPRFLLSQWPKLSAELDSEH